MEIDFYKEPRETANPYRQAYLDGIIAFADRISEKKREERKQYGNWILSHPKEAREELIRMLGWPLTESFTELPKVQKELLAHQNGIAIYRTVIEALPGIPFFGLLFLHDGEEKRPFVISQHGGQGTPEYCSGLYEDGTANYNHMTERLLGYGVNVFAPQLLLWEVKNFPVRNEKYDVGSGQRQNLDQVFKQMGGSMAALEITMLRRAIAYFAAQEYVDETRIGMVGLSYGGFYTLFTTAVEPRIRCAIAACYLSDKEKSFWSDFVFPNAAAKILDAELPLLVHPRPLWIESGKADYVFDFSGTEKEIERLRSYFGGTLPENLHYCPFEGDHEFSPEETPIREFMQELFR